MKHHHKIRKCKRCKESFEVYDVVPGKNSRICKKCRRLLHEENGRNRRGVRINRRKI